MRFATKNEKLKRYRDVAQNLSKSFRKVSIDVVPREENHVVDVLVVSASTLQPCEEPSTTYARWKFFLGLLFLIEHW
jgi:hypothetical protein